MSEGDWERGVKREKEKEGERKEKGEKGLPSKRF